MKRTKARKFKCCTGRPLFAFLVTPTRRAGWANGAAAWRMRGRRSSRRRLSHRSQQARQTRASSAAPRPHRRVLRSSSPRIQRPRRVAVPGSRPPCCVILRSTGYSATSRTAETAPSSRRRAVLTRGAIECHSRAVEWAFRPPAHRTCLRRRTARAEGPHTVRVPYAFIDVVASGVNA